MAIAVCVLLVAVIALAGICLYLISLTEKLVKKVELHSEWMDRATDLADVIGSQQDKTEFRLNVAEERILNLTNKTSQLSLKLKKMDANTIYEVKDGE